MENKNCAFASDIWHDGQKVSEIRWQPVQIAGVGTLGHLAVVEEQIEYQIPSSGRWVPIPAADRRTRLVLRNAFNLATGDVA